jgi:hypothetical protein
MTASGSFATEIGSPRNVPYSPNRCRVASIILLERLREQQSFRANYEQLKAERLAREARQSSSEGVLFAEQGCSTCGTS